MNYANIFTYTYTNLDLYAPNIIAGIVGIVAFIGILFVLRYIFLISIGAYMLFSEKKSLKKKKRILQDLILMKDIQTELEKEIEQATLKSAFQN